MAVDPLVIEALGPMPVALNYSVDGLLVFQPHFPYESPVGEHVGSSAIWILSSEPQVFTMVLDPALH